MTPRLFIVGAGGFGREVHEYARDAGAAWGGEPFEVAGFLDDNPAALAGHVGVGATIVGGIAAAEPGEQDRYVLAVGDPRLRRRLAALLGERGARFVSIVHPRAWVARESVLGDGVVVGPLSYVGPGARLGDHVLVNPQVAVAHDVQAGRWAVFSPMCAANGAVVLGDGAFLGTHATVLPGRTVGDWAYVGAGALVHRDVAPGAKVVGIPARRIGDAPAG
ncbi:MAG TPA: NeuD/PglB/VioB family sugar acetyltransferase [Kofleriaceae bacterium]|nr:NeuD/PglB/VioB family sugar acetyltransferase [Kofleriaceae bacterium]